MTTPSQRMQQGVSEIFGGLRMGARSIRLPAPDPLGILKDLTRGGPIEIDDPLKEFMKDVEFSIPALVERGKLR